MKMYVLYVRGGYEKDVVRLLKNNGILAYAPSYFREIRTKNGFRKQEKIIFTNYVFVMCDMTDEIYYKAKGTQYAVNFIGRGNPTPIYEDEAQRILTLAHGGAPFEVLSSKEDAGKFGFEVLKCDRRQGIITASFLLYGEKRHIRLGIERKQNTQDITA